MCLDWLRVTPCCLKLSMHYSDHCPEACVTSHSVLRVSRDPSWRSWHIKRVTRPSRTNPTQPGPTRLCCASWMLQQFSILSPAQLSGINTVTRTHLTALSSFVSARSLLGDKPALTACHIVCYVYATDAVSQLVRELCAVAFGFVKCFNKLQNAQQCGGVALDGGTLFEFTEFK